MEEKKSKAKLQDAATDGSLYKKMIEEIQDYAIIVLDKEGIIRNWNSGAEKIKGYSEPEILGTHFSVFYLPEDIKSNLPQKLLNEAEYTGRAAYEGWRKRKDGSMFWGSVIITAIHADTGEVIGFCKVTRDLTDKKIADDKLRVSEERYHQMVAEVEDYAIILLSVEGIIENWNVGAEKIKGYKAQEIIGKKFEIFYPDDDRRRGLPDQLLSTARQTGRASYEGWRVRKDGTEFWGNTAITALHNKDGHVIGFTKVTRDLTDKKIAEDKLAAYTAELERQNLELEQFAFVASHDLQEPLRKIQTFAELIRENLADKAFIERYLDKLDVSAKRMVELIRSLLNYSRLSKEKTPFDPVDLNVVLSESIDDFDLLIHEKQAVISLGPLPTVNGNSTQLLQLFFNLIGNSLKFSRSNPLIKVYSKTVTNDVDDVHLPGVKKYHLICFEDNGIGFESQYKEKIFSLFQRLHGKHEYAGTGIGLALCRKIVENHGGLITADGSVDSGATFRIYLPVT